MRICENGTYRDMTEEEINALSNINPYEGYSYEELVAEFIRKRYSINDELAILRQRDTKPDEYDVYNTFCEECKTKARNIVGKGDG